MPVMMPRKEKLSKSDFPGNSYADYVKRAYGDSFKFSTPTSVKDRTKLVKIKYDNSYFDYLKEKPGYSSRKRL